LSVVLPGVALFGLVLCGLALHPPGADSLGEVATVNEFVAVLAVAGAVYLLAVARVLRAGSAVGALWLVLAVAAAMRLAVLAAPPFLSSDLYRYIWDGRVQLAGVNPYRHVPADPALAGLRDAAIYPRINRAEVAPTIYPPAAQLLFRAVATIGQTPLAMRLVMTCFEIVTIGVLLHLLGRSGQPREQVLIYAWNPLAVWDFAGNGHVDAATTGLVMLALLARAYWRPAAAGMLFAVAVLMKFVPLVLAPALWRRFDWRFPAAAAVTAVLLYLCYIDAGWRVLGYLPGYGSEEGVTSGGGLWLLAGLSLLGPLPGFAAPLYFAAAAMLLLALGIRFAFLTHWPEGRAADIVAVASAATTLGFAALLLASPHYSWYYAFLAAPAALAPRWSVIFLSVAPLLLIIDPLHERFLWPALVYVPALLLAAAEYRRGRPGIGDLATWRA
jgi:hypothetical protein